MFVLQQRYIRFCVFSILKRYARYVGCYFRKHGRKRCYYKEDFVAAAKSGAGENCGRVGGSHLAKSADTITLLDVYNAINEGEEERDIFNFHPKPNPKCPVGSNIHRVLDSALEDAQNAMKDSLNKTTIADLSIDSRGSVP